MSVSFLSPYAALAGLAALVPLGAVLIRERRAGRVRATLGAAGPPARTHAPAAVALAVGFGLLGAAAAQPVVRTERTVDARTDAEAFAVFDISRSMLASASPGAPRRLERAIARGSSCAICSVTSPSESQHSRTARSRTSFRRPIGAPSRRSSGSRSASTARPGASSDGSGRPRTSRRWRHSPGTTTSGRAA